MTEGTDDGEEFLIIDFVVHFRWGQGLGMMTDGMQFLRHGRVLLPKDCS
jgi:hypothetical protein